ncbi:hypothetical protein TNCV_1845781 [Trichonephila clavipes]|nr:hypothetical protein TNCV_1845781 [Trichonephila clavipes]
MIEYWVANSERIRSTALEPILSFDSFNLHLPPYTEFFSVTCTRVSFPGNPDRTMVIRDRSPQIFFTEDYYPNRGDTARAFDFPGSSILENVQEVPGMILEPISNLYFYNSVMGLCEKLFKKARQNTEVKHGKWAKHYNRRKRDVNTKVNDWVLVETHPISSATKKVNGKFKPKFEDPYRVLRVQNNNLRKSDEKVIEAESSVSSESDYQSSSFEVNRPRLDQHKVLGVLSLVNDGAGGDGIQEEEPFITVRGTTKEEEYRSRKTNEHERPSVGEVHAKEDQSGPEENYLRGQARRTRVDTTGNSPNTRVANRRSRIQETDDPAIIVQDKVEVPNSKIAWKRMEVQ